MDSIGKSVETYCLFVGYPRSGHTLVRALLDAHHEIVISNELDALRFFEKGARVSRRALFARILAYSKMQACAGNDWTDYQYYMSDTHQGNFDTVRVVGDKKGGVSSRRIAEDKEIVNRLESTVQVPLKIIHVVRNPYDTISTMAQKSARTLSKTTDAFFEKVDVVKEMVDEGAMDILTIHHEDMVGNPRKVIGDLCAFLGVTYSKEYLDGCEKIVAKKIHKTRFDTEWPSELLGEIDMRCKKVEFLKRYTYEGV